ncbi:acyltransferase [Desulfoscipio geothermicus]|jgi:acetyltransferase-like isoleucine patch superfamily enzyme|uniref:Transferase hexapeptide (Six repeat-containing protein) n=1 Tax=Desulfoscipio geothermicus DSM 3669 TaxID=1121426 RepID=A0A1I6E376_9FIRM|nr:N-acetyltransferase [Desulfoscipio geothermicus]SFR12077.1 transferase hexapeptide (six repeat-containing protein) [Desulfoscipio geothermicus DSM 3669]
MINYIHEKADIGVNARIGHFTVVNENVKIADDVQVGHNVIIYPGTIIDQGVIVGDGAVIGKPLTVAATSTVKSGQNLEPVRIKEKSIIGALAVIYAGTVIGAYTLIGDQASVREKCQIGDFVIIGRGVCLENSVLIENYTKIQSGAYITAYTEIMGHVFVAPMVTTANDNFMGRTRERFKYIKGPVIERGARVGAGAILLPGIKVAEETFVAAGSVVTRDTGAKTLVKGIPARYEKNVPEEQLLWGTDREDIE